MAFYCSVCSRKYESLVIKCGGCGNRNTVQERKVPPIRLIPEGLSEQITLTIWQDRFELNRERASKFLRDLVDDDGKPVSWYFPKDNSSILTLRRQDECWEAAGNCSGNYFRINGRALTDAFLTLQDGHRLELFSVRKDKVILTLIVRSIT